jgi:hypothetical protein
MVALFGNPLSLTLSPLLRRGEREPAADLVMVSRCAGAIAWVGGAKSFMK